VQKRIGRPPGVDSETTRRRILGAARACFAEHGYAKTTTRMIADAAGITPATVHFHFTDKRGVFLIAYEEIDTEVMARYREAIGRHETFRDKLTALLEESLELMHDQPDIAGFLAAAPLEIRRHKELAPARATQNKYRDLYAELTDVGCLTGEVAKQDRFAVRGVLAVMINGLIQSAAVTTYLRHAQVISGIERLLDGTLLVPGQSAPQRAMAKRSVAARKRAPRQAAPR
jgi:AcrR family transcriptional regulator